MADHPSALVTWAHPDAPNLGVRALAEGTGALLREAFGEVDLEFPVFEHEPLRSLLSTRSLLKGLVRPDRALAAVIAEADILVETGGGDSFTDIYGLARLARMHHIHRAARAARVPVIFGPQTIGPFRTRAGRLLGARMLDGAAVVIARDSASAAEAARLGRPADALATDVVFALPLPAPVEGRDVALTVSGLLWNPNPHVVAEDYRSATRELISGLLARGRQVTLVPHVLDNPSPDNDVPVARELAREFPGVELVVPDSLLDVRRVLASARLVVGARMHACLNAISTGTPAIPWAYSRKFLPLMSDLGWLFGVDVRTDAATAAERTLELAASDGLGESLPGVLSSAHERLSRAASAVATVRSTR